MNKRRDTQSISNYFLPLLTLTVAAVGCAGQTPAAHDARAAGEWTFRLPETRSPYAGLAIADTGGQPTALGLVDDALAAPAAKAETPATPKSQPVTQKRSLIAANAPKAEPAPQPQAATPPSLPSAVAAQPEALALSTPPVPDARDEMRYSEREQSAKKQSNFRGGDAIVISASALVIVLLIVILILLLT